MYLLFPGRHHLLTTFQHDYLNSIISKKDSKDVEGNIITIKDPIEGIVFAVTSANHSGTKRNPLPFYLRAMMIQEFTKELKVPSYVYGIDDVGVLKDFASYIRKQIAHQSEQKINLNPKNTLVICSTPVLTMYQQLGFKILPAELIDYENQQYNHKLPWELVQLIVDNDSGLDDPPLKKQIHASTQKIWNLYSLVEKAKNILSDPIIGNDGDITESRDYNTYVRQMDEIAEIKFQETKPFILPGRIGDIGCAVGSWLKQASDDAKLRESDFYGIEVARQLFDICNQRKHNGEFKNPNIFFAQKNAVTSLVFEKDSMNTIHTSSLTHEIESYGSRSDLLSFIKNRYSELIPGGVWINRDVIGPVNGDRLIYMELNKEDGLNEDPFKSFVDSKEFANFLNNLSTYSLFLRFVQDFRKEENDQIWYEMVKVKGKEMIKLPLKDAADFMLTKDYTDNWMSEMHERFCFWSIEDWKRELQSAGFEVDENSKDYTNPWIVKNRFENKVKLYSDDLNSLSWPPTNALILARKI